MNTKRLVATAGAVVLTASLTACGSHPSYRPSAYGANGQCFYLDSPAEVIALQQAGLCPSGWPAAPAPPYWLRSYAPYYYSPAYTSHFVPAPRRTAVTSTGTTYLRDHKAEITAAQRDATYVTVKKNGSVGKVVPGSTIAKQVTSGKFGGGSARTTMQGGGNARSSCCKSSSSTSRSSSSSSSSSSSRSSSSGRR